MVTVIWNTDTGFEGLVDEINKTIINSSTKEKLISRLRNIPNLEEMKIYNYVSRDGISVNIVIINRSGQIYYQSWAITMILIVAFIGIIMFIVNFSIMSTYYPEIDFNVKIL